jgi:hypothetical protein
LQSPRYDLPSVRRRRQRGHLPARLDPIGVGKSVPHAVGSR